MSTWPPACYQRAVAYVTDRHGRLLLFDHVGDSSSGTQVPAGGILEGETPELAVLRELQEESGIESARIVRKLGEAWNRSLPGNVPAGLEEQAHHAFHLHLDGTEDETWEWDECDGGTVAKHRFAFRWASFDAAAEVLWPSQAMWLSQVKLSHSLIGRASRPIV